jgi:two-component system OmpR family sensor kinase
MTLEGAGSRVAWPWQAARRLSRRTPLRTKLITALLTLVIVALAAISVSSGWVLRSYLTEQYDSQLQSGLESIVDGPAVSVVPGTLYQYRFTNVKMGLIQPGTPISSSGSLSGSPDYGGGKSQATSLPSVPTSLAWANANNGKLVTVPAQSGSDSWRVIAEPITYPVQTSTGSTEQVTGTLVVATDLGNIDATIDRLAAANLIVDAIIVCVLALAIVIVVRANLRPLVDIEETAGEIAAGHLNRRVPERDPRTEIGSLGHSLNTMLSQIETAFHAREESEAAAHQSEERMRRFIADASHELRTPLTAIRGFAEYYRQRGGVVRHRNGASDSSDAARAVIGAGLSPDDLDRIMQRVESEAARMGLLVEDLLLLARLDQQRPLSRQPIDLLSLAADAVHDTRMLAPDRTISLSVQPGAAFLITGDEPRLRQVIGNLMSNALTHTPDGTPIEVSISSGTLDPRVEDPAPAVILDVIDHGPGMTPEQAHRVFERFYRADQARTRTKGGSGLGLAIVSALVAAHGGVASVRTAPDRGATFRVTLPLAPEAQGGLPPDEDDEEFGELEEPVTVDEASDVSVTYGTAVGSGTWETDENGAEYAPGDAAGAEDSAGSRETGEFGEFRDQADEARQDAEFTGLPQRS